MKLRELLGSPGVHVFMLAHTLAGGYTPSSGVPRARHDVAEREPCTWPCICRCAGILGVLTLRLTVEERGMRERRERKRYFVNDNEDTATRGWLRSRRLFAFVGNGFFTISHQSSCRDENYRFSIGFSSHGERARLKNANEY